MKALFDLLRSLLAVFPAWQKDLNVAKLVKVALELKAKVADFEAGKHVEQDVAELDLGALKVELGLYAYKK